MHAISGFISEHNCNIIDSQQYSLGLNARFFMRLVIEGAALSEIDIQNKFRDLVARNYQMDCNFSQKTKRMAILVSRYDHCLYDSLLKQQYGELQVEIPLIISNHADLRPVAQMFNINFLHLEIKASLDPQELHRNKLKQEKQILKALQEHSIDFVALARYMQILSPNFIEHYPHHIINVHHSFLPAFAGANPYHQAYAKGVKIIGATAHYATEDLDMGPIIAQDVIEVGHRDSVQDYIAKGRDIEQWVFSKALKAHAEDKIIVHEGRTIVFD